MAQNDQSPRMEDAQMCGLVFLFLAIAMGTYRISYDMLLCKSRLIRLFGHQEMNHAVFSQIVFVGAVCHVALG